MPYMTLTGGETRSAAAERAGEAECAGEADVQVSTMLAALARLGMVGLPC